MIEWNDGLNIGIKVLDDDHKKLLEIITTLSHSENTGLTQEKVSEIFDDLQMYGLEHFHREESFMKRARYSKFDEHVNEHKIFVDTINTFKNKLLDSQDTATIYEASTFLTQWLVNHIIKEDMKLLPAFEKSGLIEYKKDDASLFCETVNRISQTISFSKRIILSALIPLIVTSILGLIIILNNYNNYTEMKTTSNITYMIKDVNNLIHTLQIERGLSSGYLSSKSNKYTISLAKQYLIVDEKIKIFSNNTNLLDTNKITLIRSNIKQFNKDILLLAHLRKMIHAKEVSRNNAISAYTKIIDNILAITHSIAFTNNNVVLAQHITTLASLSRFKEALGQKRAYGTMLLEIKNARPQEYFQFAHIISSQKVHLKMFENSSTQEYIDLVDTALTSSNALVTRKYENFINKHNFENLDSKVWFSNSTNLINDIKIIEDLLLKKIISLIDEDIQQSMQNLLLWSFLIISILIITFIIIYFFEYSSKKELHEFTVAMKHLTDGERTLRLEAIPLKDAMSQMYISYEEMRTKLLEGDIYTQLFKKQKEIEIKNKQLQNEQLEELASIDSLTGCVNRRKFEEYSNIELQRASRHKSPLSFLMLDIDHFKKINDTYGHAVGDKVLQHFADECLSLARDTDVVARIGGEEFVVMLPETNIDGAFMFAQRFRERIYNSQLSIDNQEIKYSVSIGISILDVEHDTKVSMVLHKADLALYEAKHNGRNRCLIYEDSMAKN